MSPEPLQLHAFVDGELELARQLELEARLQDDPLLRLEVERLRELRQRVRAQASYHAAPPTLRQALRESLAKETTLRARPPTAPRQPVRWWSWPVIAPAFAAILALLVAVPVVLLPAREDQRIEHDVLASHARAVVARHLVDVASSDHHTVKPWLSARLDFSPPVDPPAGSELLGARVDYVDGRPVATLVLRHAGHTVDHFVWPVGAKDAAAATSSERGFQLAHWTHGGMRHWVVSDLNPQEFAALVRALQAQP